MKFMSNIKWLLCLFAALSVLSCKRNIGPEKPVEPIDPNEVIIKALAPSLDASNAVSSRAVLPASFGRGSAVGLYTRWKDESDLTKTLQANSFYSYSEPTWTPNSKADKLMYHEFNYPIYIYGYHPFVRAQGSSTTLASSNDSLNINYKMFRDFNTEDSLRMADLLWSKATGIDGSGSVTEDGYTRQGKPVVLPFRHKLCKISYYIKVVDSHPSTGSPTQCTINKVWIESEDLNAETTLNVITGDMVHTKVSELDSVVWSSDEGVLVNVGAPASTFIADMIVIPFEVTSVTTTRIRIRLQSGPDQIYFTVTVPIYNGNPYPQPANGNRVRFAENDFNLITMTVDVSQRYIYLDSKIEPWGPENGFDLDTEKD